MSLDAENLIAPSTEEETSPCNAESNCSKQGLWKRSKYGALTVVLLLLVGLVLTAVVVRQKAPLQSSTDFIEEDMAQNMLDAVNQERRKRGRNALCYNSKLNNAALLHSQDQASMSHMTHTGSDGSDAGQRVTRAGYVWNAYAENVARGQTSVSAVMNTWMNSFGHRKNILDRDFTHFGYGVQNHYWTQVFGAGGSESCSQGSGGGAATCVFPTTYGGKSMPGCTTEGHGDEAWCYTAKGPGYWRACTAADNACSFPFTYQGTKYWHGCTSDGHTEAWCYTSQSSGTYKECSAADDACSFPFTYKGKEYRQCTNEGHEDGQAWCYKVGGGWKNC